MVVALLLRRDQLALRHDLDHRDVRAFVEELGGREVEHAVVLGDDQEAVLGPAHAVGVGELQARREGLDLVGQPSLLRSVTAQTVVLRVPTNSMLVLGATAMWRASGTIGEQRRS